MFTHTQCDPAVAEVIELGPVKGSELISTFEEFPWDEMIAKMKAMPLDEVNYSPSLGFALPSDNRGIEISYLADVNGEHIFYLFYKRPKRVRKLFGLINKFEREYLSELRGRKIRDCLDLIDLFAKQDFDAIELMFEGKS